MADGRKLAGGTQLAGTKTGKGGGKEKDWYIPPTRGRDSLGFLSPRDVPRAVSERS